MSSPGDKRINRAEFDTLFKELGDELLARGCRATIVLAGGAYMAYLDLRESTGDADSLQQLPEHIKDAVAAVGSRHDLRADWLNDHAIAWAPPGASNDPPYTFFENESLTIQGPHPDTVFLMKINGSRPMTEDRRDAIALWPMTTFQTAQQVIDAFYQAFPNEEHDEFLIDHVDGIIRTAERHTAN